MTVSLFQTKPSPFRLKKRSVSFKQNIHTFQLKDQNLSFETSIPFA